MLPEMNVQKNLNTGTFSESKLYKTNVDKHVGMAVLSSVLYPTLDQIFQWFHLTFKRYTGYGYTHTHTHTHTLNMLRR